MKIAALFLTAAFVSAADQPTTKVALTPVADRKPAPVLALANGSGKTVNLNRYKGKVVLLDFWATWCTGCKQEIPWFVQFQKIYRPKGLAVVGVSMDDGGWKVLEPFLTEHPIPYPVLLGDDPTAKLFAIDVLPDTFLIDRRGRLAAAYTSGLVDKDNVEANLKSLLAER